jgi:large subunit ribosomal protein L15
LPPEDAVPYYIDPKNRGYLADPKDIAQARLELSQKYGYRLPDLMSENDSRERDMLMERKDARQVFYGLWPGWVINMHDKVIIKPKDEELLEFYAS